MFATRTASGMSSSIAGVVTRKETLANARSCSQVSCWHNLTVAPVTSVNTLLR